MNLNTPHGRKLLPQTEATACEHCDCDPNYPASEYNERSLHLDPKYCLPGDEMSAVDWHASAACVVAVEPVGRCQ